MKFHHVSWYKDFLIFLSGSLILSVVALSGCIDTNENQGFIVKSWSTQGYGTYQVNLTVAIETQWSSGHLDLYDPSEKLVDDQYFSNTTHQITFLIPQTSYKTPKFGVYHLYATEIIEGNNHSRVKKDIILDNANLTITKCIPTWVFDTTIDSYLFKSVNFTVENHGDFFGFIYEGRIIVDNGSIFLAPDYHWHNLNLWIAPTGNISLDLPVEVPIRPQENHYVKIFLQDKQLVTVASYEAPLYLPSNL